MKIPVKQLEPRSRPPDLQSRFRTLPAKNMDCLARIWIFFAIFCLIALLGQSDSGGAKFRKGFTTLTASLYPSEYEALHDLYVSTNGGGWKYRSGALVGNKWNFTSGANPCTDRWQGVTCTLVAPYYHIRYISLANFKLRGSLPDSLDRFAHMTYFSVPLNFLNGTLPASLGNLTNLSHLDVSSNFLTGPVPDSLGRLRGLQTIDLTLNAFTGPFPRALQNLTALQAVALGGNRFNGTLPCWLGRLTELGALYLYMNSFTGTLPVCLCSFPILTVLDVSNNQLSGPVPEEVANIAPLVSLFLYNNSFTGTLPSTLGSLAALQDLEVYSNQLTGGIPGSYGDLRQLQVLALYGNDLSGTLPDSLGALRQLRFFYADSNRLSGSLPGSFATMNRTTLLDLHGNTLTGTLPSYFGNFTLLAFLILYSNRFSGTVPRTLNGLTLLQELQLQDNRLTGSLEGVFEPSQQRALGVVQLDDNQLTGTIPPEAFQLGQLTTFVAVGNCLHGTLPASVCAAPLLKVLVLDGASSAPACRSALLPGVASSYTTHTTLYGSLPACLFQLPFLTTLHLSGNGFTGPLPDVTNASQALQDVALSHNLLTGAIPDVFQRRQWASLDLSYNRLSGSLRGDFASLAANHPLLASFERQHGVSVDMSQIALYPVLRLESNRLSGRIPGALQSLYNVSVLGTNLFACALDHSDLPAHDSGRDNYQCGSDSFNVPYFLWLGLAALAVTAVATAAVVGVPGEVVGGVAKKLNKWSSHALAFHSAGAYFAQLHILLRTALCCTAFIVVVLLPIYITLAHISGTVTHAYAWQASAAFLTGYLPVACECVAWTVLLCVGICVFDVLTRTNSALASYTSPHQNGEEAGTVLTGLSARKAAIYAVFLLLNLVVVVGVNAAFVYVAIYQSSGLLIAAQVLISLFKLAWNNQCSAGLLLRVTQLFSKATSEAEPAIESEGTGALLSRPAAPPLLLLVLASLLNNVVIPCLVVALVSPSCFYEVFEAAPAVTSTFSYPRCVLDDSHDCVTYTQQTTSISYDPPFRYSFQCSASFVTYYAPAYVILCLVVTFASPLSHACAVVVHQRAVPGGWLHWLSLRALPRNLQPISRHSPPCNAKDSGSACFAIGLVPEYAGANRVLIIVVTFLGLLLTFGAVFPPLAAALLLAIVSTVYGARVRLGRFLSMAGDAGRQDLVAAVEAECGTAVRLPVLRRTVWALVTLSCWFYTLYLFDTLGDAVGFRGALWVLIVMPTMPIILYAAYSVVQWVVAARAKGSHHSSGKLSIELTQLAAQPGSEEVRNALQVGVV